MKIIRHQNIIAYEKSLDSEVLQMEKEELKRTGDWSSDLLHLYESFSMYDCTFRVGISATTSKIFKCHKLILAVASKVFETMFHGNFAEANKGPDDEIKIDDTEPMAFDAAMRFVYGRRVDFVNDLIAAQVYKFANMWQIQNLMDAADLYLKEPSPGNVAFVYEIFKQAGNQKGLGRCMEVMSANIKEVLSSSHWQNASLDLIMDVLSQGDLNVDSECDLLEGLYRWGEANTKDRIGKPSDAMVREAIKKPLEKIRFLSMEHQEFAAFCSKNKNNIFTAEEKWNIIMSISIKSAENLPENFSSEMQPRVNVKKAVWLDLLTFHSGYRGFGYPVHPSFIDFSVNKNIHFFGLKFMSFAHFDCNFMPDSQFEITNEGERIWEGTTKDYDVKLQYYKAKKPPLLKEGVRYQLSVKHSFASLPDQTFFHQSFSEWSISKESLTVTLHNRNSSAAVGFLIIG
ncbi:BTB/POZ domain-containing protein 2-like isoform X2 [Neocloeon triangulifer]|uniref:BTB/POZ domain-containing protein 2-like isoform X2 n=1 Tax=Neocloeon triangulifer TaxID=2078957 RepID=UPI00286F354D|nr:BTB/POZ domain-containing protein 2-like isoform X2 [Neocloeon triangulifer]